jgi:hypothetical protein
MTNAAVNTGTHADFGVGELEALQAGLTRLAALLETDEPRRMDACERLDLWQHLYAVRSRLPLVEWALSGGPQSTEPAQSAGSPSADDISALRRTRASRARSRSVRNADEEVTGLRTSR